MENSIEACALSTITITRQRDGNSGPVTLAGAITKVEPSQARWEWLKKLVVISTSATESITPQTLAYLPGIPKPIPVVYIEAEKYQGKFVYTTINPKTGENSRVKYYIDENQQLRPIPLVSKFGMKNIPNQKLELSGKGAASKAVKQKIRPQQPQADTDSRMASSSVTADSSDKSLATNFEQKINLSQSPHRPEPVSSPSLATTSASAPIEQETQKELVLDDYASVYFEKNLNKLIIVGIINKAQHGAQLEYDLEKNVFWSVEGNRCAYVYPPQNKKWLIKLSKSALKNRVVTDQDRTETIKRLKINIDISLDSLFESSRAKEIPKKIISIWIGNKKISDDILNILKKNTALVKEKNNTYKYKIYLSKEAMKINAELLKKHVHEIDIIDLEDTEIYRDFSNSKNFPQYLEAIDDSNNKPTNFASACDILRLFILKKEGGLYMDVDNTLMPNFMSRRLVTMTDKNLLVGEPFIDKAGENYVYVFNNNMIGTQPDNPIFDKMQDLIHKRRSLFADFYHTHRPASQKETEHYRKQLFLLTGPGIIDCVLKEDDPAITNAVKIWKKLDKFPIIKKKYFSKAFPLSDIAQSGDNNSWAEC